MKNRTKVYVVDDHEVVRNGLSQYINESEDFVVVGGSGDSDVALREINAVEPDVIIMDITLKGISGIELTEVVLKRHSSIKVLMHSMHKDPVYIERSFRAGAIGYLSKDEPVENVIIGLKAVVNNNRYLNEELQESLISILLSVEGKNPMKELTNREFEVFLRMGKGMDINEIAEDLKINKKTVSTYRDRIKEKLGFKKSKDLLHFSFGWVSDYIHE